MFRIVFATNPPFEQVVNPNNIYGLRYDSEYKAETNSTMFRIIAHYPQNSISLFSTPNRDDADMVWAQLVATLGKLDTIDLSNTITVVPF